MINLLKNIDRMNIDCILDNKMEQENKQDYSKGKSKIIDEKNFTSKIILNFSRK